MAHKDYASNEDLIGCSFILAPMINDVNQTNYMIDETDELADELPFSVAVSKSWMLSHRRKIENTRSAKQIFSN